MTNSRAFPPREAARLTSSAAAAALAVFPTARVVLRGDSTLRGHLIEEYDALCRQMSVDGEPPLLLVPALPSAGRVTRGGIHFLISNGRTVSLDQTEYSNDGQFAYSSSNLAQWSEERSGGRFRSSEAKHIDLEQIRGPKGPESVARSLEEVWREGQPAIVAPDAETDEDLETIAAGLRQVERNSVPVITRCAPAFAGVLAGSTATRLEPAPSAESGVLILCGSYVPNTTEQLADLDATFPNTRIVADPSSLLSDRSSGEIARIQTEANRLIETKRLAVIATPRKKAGWLTDVNGQTQLADALARTVAGTSADVLITKGGVTSATGISVGMGAAWARVEGPVLPGVSIWRVPEGRCVLVVPGNIGNSSLLSDLVKLVLKCG